MAPKRTSAREATPTTKKKEAEVLKAQSPAKVTKGTSPAKKTTAASTSTKVHGRMAKKTPAKDLTDMQKETTAKNAVKSGKKTTSTAKSATKKTTTKKPTPAPEPDDDEDDDPLGTEGLYVEEPAKTLKTKKQSPKVKDKTYRDHHDPADDAVEDEPEPEKPRRAGRKGSVYKPDADDDENEDGDALEPPKRGRGRPRKSDSPKKGTAKGELAAKSGSGKRGRPKKAASRPAGPLSQKDATAALRQQAEIVKKIGSRHTLGGPTPESRNHLRAAFFMLKSALFGGGMYAKASKAEARRLRDLCQGMDDDIARAVVAPYFEEDVLDRNLRWTDIDGTGGMEEDVVDYLTRFPVYDGDDLAEIREEMEDLGMWEDDSKGLADYLTGRVWDVLKECKYGMAELGDEDAVEGLEMLERQWKLLTREDPDSIILGLEKEEAAMKRRVRKMWRKFEDGAAQTAGMSVKEVDDADSTTEDEDEQMLDEDVVVPTIEPTTTTGRKASKSTTSRNGRTPSPLKPSRAPLRSPSRSPAARNKAQPGLHPGPILYNEQTRLGTPRASSSKTKGTPSPSPQTKQRREGVQNGFSTTPKRGSGASARSYRSAEEAAASAAQLQDEMAEGLKVGSASVTAAGSKRGSKASQSRLANDNAGESSHFPHHTATTSSSKEPFRGTIHASGGSDPSDDDDSSSDHGFPHLSASRRPSRRSTSPAPLRPPPDRSGITGPPVGSRERLQAVLRHVATAEEQRVFDGYEERVVKLPKKYYEHDEADDDDGDAGDDDNDSSERHMRRSPAKSPRPSSAQGGSRPSRSHGSDGKAEDPWSRKFTTATNPERLEGLDDRPNPFHEKLPGPETWYQRMPNVFPFGETPFQESEMSRQINEDLNRGHEREVEETNRAEAAKNKHDQRSPSVAERIAGAVGTLFGRTQTPEEQTPATSAAAASPAASTTDSAAVPPPGPWDLPEVEDQRVEDGLKEFQEFFRHVEHKDGSAEGRRESRKRTQQEAAEGRPGGKKAKRG